MKGSLHDKNTELKEVTVALKDKEDEVQCLQKTVGECNTRFLTWNL